MPFSLRLERENGDVLALFVAPLVFEPLEGRETAGFWQVPRQFVWFFISLDKKPKSRIDIVMTLLRVSPAEAELALSLLQDKKQNEHAEERSISKYTVRNQMQSLLGKTGCRSQAELVGKLNRLFASFNW